MAIVQALRRSGSNSRVVPANAGTDNHRRRWPAERRLPDPPKRRAPGVYRINVRPGSLIDRADQILDLLRMGSKVLGKLVQIRIGDRAKTLLGGSGLFQFERLGRLLGADFRRRRLHPSLLLSGKALPQSVADEQQRVV